MEMEDQYGMADLRQLMNGRPHYPTIPPAAELFSGHRNQLAQTHQLEMLMVGRQIVSDHHHVMPRGLHHQHHDQSSFPSHSTTTNTNNNAVTATSTASLGGLVDADLGCLGGDGGTGRWPRQETLTLLEIRSRLDPKFKEANQKGPLWDEVSRIMSEEHGYQRSGKKCREKFENLYKYYKKTKEGKAGRQDGKHYRFFRQLEALYGETASSHPISGTETHLVGNSHRFHITNNQQANQETFHSQKLCDSLSLSNSSEFETSSSDDNDLNTTVLTENESGERRNNKKRRGRRSWKLKIKDFIDSQMRRLMEKQEAWLDKMLKTLEHKEQERMLREEKWRKQEASRLDREQKFWANERAWIKARDVALMEALQKLSGRELKASSPEELMVARELQNEGENQNENASETLNKTGENSWSEYEISRLIELRTGMESRIRQSGSPEDVLWEDIAAKLGCFGYDRTASMCREKWNTINEYLISRTSKDCNKKRKETSRGSCYFPILNDSVYNQGGVSAYCDETARLEQDDSSSPVNSNAVQDSCFRFLMTDGDNLWENYGMKLNKGESH
ncbi:trihelix transcription factor PTL [Malania oleifera]|uniref:trihelix transcription factor PTL n=1 Tax=Malania oleifera TaxID=397392 RepID=UPI0025AE8654|nr:trihelix transcription factor PTL [Malania oleifera]